MRRLFCLAALLAQLAAAAPEPHYAGTLAGSPSGLQTAVDGPRLAAVFRAPRQAVVDAQGAVWVADTGNQLIRRIAADGQVSTLAGQLGQTGFADGVGSSALFNEPSGVLPAPQGGVWVLDSNNGRIRHVAADGRVSTLAGGGQGAGGSRHADGQGTAAAFNEPRGFAQDAAGNLYVADAADHAIRRVDRSGRSSVWAGRPGSYGFADGAATLARFRKPAGLAVAADGTLYVADSGNHAVRRIAPDGQVSTLAGNGERGSRDGAGSAAQFNEPMGLALAPDGALYVADFGSHTLRRVTATGQVSTVAGSAGQGGFVDGAATGAARLRSPVDVAVGGDGKVYVLDRSNHAVRVLDGAGQLSTLAGSGSAGLADGSGRSARFQFPSGLAPASDGGLWVADTDNQRLRHVSATGEVSSPLGQQLGRADGVGSAARFFNPKDVAAGADGRPAGC
ncbi:hypothetical protein [Inhella sp.]|uniref:hypothetical protein n=1 Tax=Inhella sp. TaxID=1921806 RepID=UPI0035ADF265